MAKKVARSRIRPGGPLDAALVDKLIEVRQVVNPRVESLAALPPSKRAEWLQQDDLTRKSLRWATRILERMGPSDADP